MITNPYNLYEEPEVKTEYITPTTGNWYITFFISSIPIFRAFYLFYLAFFKKDESKKNYAKARILFYLTKLTIGILLIYIGIKLAIPYLEEFLNYLEQL